MGNNTNKQADGQEEIGAAVHCFMDIAAREAEKYAAEHTSPMSALLEEIESYTLNNTEYPSMLTGRRLLVRARRGAELAVELALAFVGHRAHGEHGSGSPVQLLTPRSRRASGGVLVERWGSVISRSGCA